MSNMLILSNTQSPRPVVLASSAGKAGPHSQNPLVLSSREIRLELPDMSKQQYKANIACNFAYVFPLQLQGLKTLFSGVYFKFFTKGASEWFKHKIEMPGFDVFSGLEKLIRFADHVKPLDALSDAAQADFNKFYSSKNRISEVLMNIRLGVSWQPGRPKQGHEPLSIWMDYRFSLKDKELSGFADPFFRADSFIAAGLLETELFNILDFNLPPA